MTEPYRTSGLACPKCPGASLREFQQRYVCDECQGILIAETDLIHAIEDLACTTQKLEYRDDKPTETKCPRCERAMVACRATVVGDRRFKLRHDLLRCDRDGLWCPDGALAAVFAKVGRRWGGGPSYETVGAGSKQTGLDGLPLRSYAPATAGLRISQWRDRGPRRRPATLTPINAYADRRLPCPICPTALDFQGDRWTCASCLGAFIQQAAFEGLVYEMIDRPWEMPAPNGAAGPRACPVCSAVMVVEKQQGIEIDRCAGHGIWFDAGELATALERAGLEDGGVGAWLKKLFFTG